MTLHFRFCLLVFCLLPTLSAQATDWNVFMVGDSHVCSKIYPEKVEAVVESHEHGVSFSFFGKIGAGFYTYNESPDMMREIYEAVPDILVVHLGTNDSFTSRFSPAKFLADVEVFYGRVESRFPDCRVVFVTPFFNRLPRSKKSNKNTRRCADALLEFASSRSNAFVIDNNADFGMFFLKNSTTMMRHDCVHLTEQGYEALGRQVGEALVAIDDLWLLAEPPYLPSEAN